MQEKEVTTQPRTKTATLVEYMRRCANEDRNCDNEPNKGFSEIADRLEEQENKIGILEDALGESSTWASSLRNTIGKLQAEIDLLNKRPKR